MSKVIMFHGASCPHCHHMMPIVDKLIEEGFEIEKLEVWSNPENAAKMRENKDTIIAACGDGLGVPTFFEPVGKRALCGEYTYEELKEWIQK